MPWGDGTGPLGQGPRTGRGAGYCNGFKTPGYVNRGFGFGFGRWGGRGYGFGFGRGRGFGFGFRRWWWGKDQFVNTADEQTQTAPAYPDFNEEGWLKQRINALKNELANLEKRLSEILKKEG